MNTTDYERAIVRLLRNLSHHLYAHSRQMVRRCGLTGPQAITLQELLRNGEMSVGSLAKRISLSAGTVSGILDRLESRGLVERTRSEADRRSMVVDATPQASGWFDGDLSLLNTEFSNRLAELSDDEKQSILHALGMLADMLGGTSDASPISTGPETCGYDGIPLHELVAKE